MHGNGDCSYDVQELPCDGVRHAEKASMSTPILADCEGLTQSCEPDCQRGGMGSVSLEAGAGLAHAAGGVGRRREVWSAVLEAWRPSQLPRGSGPPALHLRGGELLQVDVPGD